MAHSEELTILYLTDSILDPVVADLCRGYLWKARNGCRVVSVSQEPLDFGDNVCVGKLPYVALSIDIQLKAGLNEVSTPFVAVAEHDCVYSPEHFEFLPSDPESFWYNDNCWLVQYRHDVYPQYNGMYSYFGKRRVQSQLTCGADVLREAVEDKVAILSDPAWLGKYPRGRIGEPGTNDTPLHYKRNRTLSGGVSVRHLWRQIKDYITKYNACDWKSNVPNIDIRHGQNFTGHRRGTSRTWDLPPWGRFEDVLRN